MRSVEEFRDLLNRLSWQGFSQIAEVSQLSVLIKKYPAQAREIVNQLDGPATGDA
ncbi:hypothetical protein [Actinoallomurus sp. NPDC050550]|uniref:hypothetical protein n=1 Tax=Actinoallomurus sp. NPDC050550 TaxID=3154937 RepID=UPI0033F9F80F